MGKHSRSLEAGGELGSEPGICIRLWLRAIGNPSSRHPESSPEAGRFQVGQCDGSTLSPGTRVLSLPCFATLTSQILPCPVPPDGHRRVAADSGATCRSDRLAEDKGVPLHRNVYLSAKKPSLEVLTLLCVFSRPELDRPREAYVRTWIDYQTLGFC